MAAVPQWVVVLHPTERHTAHTVHLGTSCQVSCAMPTLPPRIMEVEHGYFRKQSMFRAGRLYFQTIRLHSFLISCCWCKPSPNWFYASQKDSGLEDRPIVQGRTSPVDASQKSHPCNVVERMNAQHRYQSFQMINKVYDLNSHISRIKTTKKKHEIVGRTYHFFRILGTP